MCIIYDHLLLTQQVQQLIETDLWLPQALREDFLFESLREPPMSDKLSKTSSVTWGFGSFRLPSRLKEER
ncbi:hypothetical protein E2C01_030933 [Portunus trituberculatus]|uniref:Uncharacterized protein n=1 Tax=Portunus trituberculatus TaxID=210409 RepID=A0A5B7EX69_PORTR|nr:hypothetical protein [Portunus trituberculatus]